MCVGHTRSPIDCYIDRKFTKNELSSVRMVYVSGTLTLFLLRLSHMYTRLKLLLLGHSHD